MKTGDRIKQRRESLGISQTELAAKTNTTKQNIYKYENNIVLNIPTERLELIASALQTTPAYLMGWSDNKAKLTVSRFFYPTSIEMQDFTKNLKRYREALNISFEALSNLTGIRKKDLVQYESGQIKQISLANIKKIATALNITANELLGWDDLTCCDDSINLFLDWLSYLGYEVETTDRPNIEFPIIEDNAANEESSHMFWIRYRKDNSCYRIKYEDLEHIELKVQEYLNLLVQNLIQNSDKITKPQNSNKLSECFDE